MTGRLWNKLPARAQSAIAGAGIAAGLGALLVCGAIGLITQEGSL